MAEDLVPDLVRFAVARLSSVRVPGRRSRGRAASTLRAMDRRRWSACRASPCSPAAR
ncbi:MAG: hypothetical protein MZV64_48995 [Ignavibacteriales bacterium]|nr:hypothetical protein [Ignavibacteriales bacterium]